MRVSNELAVFQYKSSASPPDIFNLRCRVAMRSNKGDKRKDYKYAHLTRPTVTNPAPLRLALHQNLHTLNGVFLNVKVIYSLTKAWKNTTTKKSYC